MSRESEAYKALAKHLHEAYGVLADGMTWEYLVEVQAELSGVSR